MMMKAQMLNPRDLQPHIAAKHANEPYKPPLKLDESVVEKYVEEKKKRELSVYKFHEAVKAKNATTDLSLAVFTCDICGTKVNRKRQILVHMCTHFQREFKCTDCDEKFDGKHQLEHHRLQHEIRKGGRVNFLNNMYNPYLTII